MRQITCDAVDAFVNGRRFKRANTEVRGKGYYLHGHKIAWYDFRGRLWISNCGYQTVTTKERLNGLPNVNIKQKNWQWYLNGQKWDGEPICVDNFK